MKKRVPIIAAIILHITAGCSDVWNFIDKLPPNTKPNPVLEIFPHERPFSYKELRERVEIIKSSLKKNHPEGLVVYLEKGEYVALKSTNNTLKTTLYKCGGKINEIEDFLVAKKDKTNLSLNFFDIKASETLNQVCEEKVILYDSGKPGIEQEDFAQIINDKGYTIFRGNYTITGKNFLEGKLEEMETQRETYRRVNEVYLSITRPLTPE